MEKASLGNCAKAGSGVTIKRYPPPLTYMSVARSVSAGMGERRHDGLIVSSRWWPRT